MHPLAETSKVCFDRSIHFVMHTAFEVRCTNPTFGLSGFLSPCRLVLSYRQSHKQQLLVERRWQLEWLPERRPD